MSLKQLIQLLFKYRLWIITIPVLVAVTVYFLSQNLPNQYESKAVVFTSPSSTAGSENGNAGRVDFYSSNNLFDNLILLMKSRGNLTDASLKLIAMHLSMEQAAPETITKKSFAELNHHIPPALKNEIAVIGDPDKTHLNLIKYHNQNADSVFDYLLREHPHYGLQDILENLYVVRRSSSDMVEVGYKSDDPGVCYHTLKFILSSFMDKYDQIKVQENTNSIRYFEEQLRIAQERLVESELKLKNFISAHQILNYYEQGKYLDIAKLEQDQDEERAKRLASGTKSNLDQIETLFSKFDVRKNTIDSIAALQSDLNKKQMEMDGLKLLGPKDTSYILLSNEIKSIQKELENKSETLFNSSLSVQGVPRKDILEEWLRLKLQYEEQVQSIEVMQSRKAYINDKINEFAPLGAELKQLEREVEVNENHYLSILNGLNVANLRKHELKMSSSQNLIDPPFFPKKPLPSKKKILVAGGFVGSGFMIITFILLFYFMDTSIKSAEKVKAITGIPVAGGWIDERKIGKKVIKPLLSKRQIKQFYNHISVNLNKHGKRKLIVMYSIRDGEGKSFLAQKLIKELTDHGSSVTWVGPDEKNNIQIPLCSSVSYPKDSAEINNHSYLENYLAEGKNETMVMELPNIQQHHINFELMNKADLAILVMDASRSWELSDKLSLENVQKGTNTPQVIWLNKMNKESLEELNGEIPKDRNKLGMMIKNLLS